MSLHCYCKLIHLKELNIADLQKDLSRADTDRETLVQELKTSEAENMTLQENLSQSETKNENLFDKFTKKSDELGKLQDELEKAREIAQGARQLMIDLREQIVEFEKQRNRLTTDLSISKNEREKLEENLKEKEWTLGKLVEHGVDIPEIVARQGEPDVPIHAKVLAVRPDVNIVLVSVGKQDKVKPGYRFTIYRRGTYVGKVQIENVYPSMSSARILVDLLAKSQSIMEGDNASTRVY